MFPLGGGASGFFIGFILIKMANKSYSEKLKHPKWQRKRLEIMQRDGFKCKLCSDEETTLNIHHLEYSDGEPWEIENEKLITLCENCHREIETLKSSDGNIDYNNLSIIKSDYDDGSYIYFIQYQEQILLRYKNGKDTGGFYLYSNEIDKLNKLKNKAKKYKKDNGWIIE